jgi:hypothetical protein
MPRGVRAYEQLIQFSEGADSAEGAAMRSANPAAKAIVSHLREWRVSTYDSECPLSTHCGH